MKEYGNIINILCSGSKLSLGDDSGGVSGAKGSNSEEDNTEIDGG